MPVKEKSLVELGAKIRAFRESRGWSREACAIKLGVSASTLACAENGSQKLGKAPLMILRSLENSKSTEYNEEGAATLEVRDEPAAYGERMRRDGAPGLDQLIELVLREDLQAKAKAISRVSGLSMTDAMVALVKKELKL